ncbi:MAG TPA: primosomal protein N' [Vicinamibacterales bacterium]|nr:primosomal protein N' [Vicinamibacterales bacterium]
MLISVAVPVPYLDSLTYRVPDGIDAPPVGARVRVPLGSRIVTGCVIEHVADPHVGSGFGRTGDLRDIAAVVDREPFLPPTVVDLCRWVADYYMAGIGDAVGAAMPPRARDRESGFRTRRLAAITTQGLSALDGRLSERGSHAGGSCEGGPDGPPLRERDRSAGADDASRVEADLQVRLTGKQRAALDVLAPSATGLPVADLRERGVTADVLARLAVRGLIAFREEADERDPFERAAMADVAADPSRVLTTEQASALEALSGLADAAEFKVALLHGVTGSGKTELYLRLADRVCRAGRQVLLMVPEIALTPSVAALFRSAFGARVAIQHSALSDGERHDQWQRIRRGDIDVVVGTRSAVFAPLPRVGLIVVDEEHDGSYKQEEAPRYHGRDVAIVRASREHALVVLGSATPALESYQNAVTGKYTRIALGRRVLDRPLAAVRLVDMREEYASEGPDVVISRALAASIGERLERREQVVVLLNRRGYATAVFCRQCGDTFECPNCSISLTVHRARGQRDSSVKSDVSRTPSWRARCHYCNYSMTVPKQCRKCAAPYLEHAGFGTEKVEQHLKELFPDARIGRVDRDSVRRKGALTSILSRFGAGEIDVLVGTQMIAKGHDFPRVTLVGVISADVGLGLADFRAGERTFQLLTQVAGRAGRGERAGEAIVQTLYPEHYSIQFACRQDYAGFFDREIAFRRGMRYPPVVALVNVIVRGRTFDEAMRVATGMVTSIAPSGSAAGFSVLGPAPAPLTRLRGEHRVQFFLKGTRRSDMRAALQAVLAENPEIRKRVTVDVDPLSVL